MDENIIVIVEDEQEEVTLLIKDVAIPPPAGSGDMIAATYDPLSKQSNAFDMDNMDEGVNNKIFSNSERTKLSSIENRNNHTGTQTASTISDFDTEVGNHPDVVANTAKQGVTNEEENTIDSITAGEPSGSGVILNVVFITEAEHTAGPTVNTTLYIITDAT